MTICSLDFVISCVEAEILAGITRKVRCSGEAKLKWFILWVLSDFSVSI